MAVVVSMCLVYFLLTLLLKSRMQRPPRLLRPQHRPQEDWETGLKLEKCHKKRNAGKQKTASHFLFHPFVPPKPWWSAWPCRLNLFVETWIRLQGITFFWRQSCHLFHPLINLSELVGLRVIITCFGLWALAVVTTLQLVPAPEENRGGSGFLSQLFSWFSTCCLQATWGMWEIIRHSKRQNLFARFALEKIFQFDWVMDWLTESVRDRHITLLIPFASSAEDINND